MSIYKTHGSAAGYFLSSEEEAFREEVRVELFSNFECAASRASITCSNLSWFGTSQSPTGVVSGAFGVSANSDPFDTRDKELLLLERVLEPATGTVRFGSCALALLLTLTLGLFQEVETFEPLERPLIPAAPTAGVTKRPGPGVQEVEVG